MSWQATNYVKNLGECPDGARLSPRQKCLLFVLADYHNTAHRAVWPSVQSLAEESLQSKRQVYRDLAYFEKHGLLVRSNRGGGQGVTLAFEFPELDQPPALKGDRLSPFSAGLKGDRTVTKGCQEGAPNKEKAEPEPETPSPPAPPPGAGGGARAPSKRELRQQARQREALVGVHDPSQAPEPAHCWHCNAEHGRVSPYCSEACEQLAAAEKAARTAPQVPAPALQPGEQYGLADVLRAATVRRL